MTLGDWPPQRRIGLTGGIASGKSSVAALLEKRGCPVLDADLYAREALAPGTSASKAVVARYGERVQNDGTSGVDRAGLASIVFNDPNERSWLELLVHPIVQQRFDEALQSLPEAPIVILMIPLLFEAGLEGWCSEIWVVHCTALQQKERLMARNNCTEAEAMQRIEAQWPIDNKVNRADHVINNSGLIDDLQDQLDALLKAK
ncbi:MAG: dephospho-CoA kinase [Synechococcus sp. SP1 MAG]|jgi:dephospho-CoA kinase|nr:dephospho-CoA kinase [Synechococcus sp. SP1 MAG]